MEQGMRERHDDMDARLGAFSARVQEASALVDAASSRFGTAQDYWKAQIDTLFEFDDADELYGEDLESIEDLLMY